MATRFVPCLVCDPKLRRKPEIEFLHPKHHKTHNPGLPQDHDSYLKWVAEKYEIDPEHAVFEQGALTKPNEFKKHEHLFE